nr:PREDICTED: uncharacterized protein LOC109041058 [Bemisia tabaci]
MLIRFGDIEDGRILSMGTFLDPRFKKLHFEKATAVSNLLKNKAHEMTNASKEREKSERNDDNLQEQLQQEKQTGSSLWGYHDTKRKTECSNSSLVELGGFPLQLRQYIAEDTADRKANPFKEWEQKLKMKYPDLYPLMRKYATVQGSSAAAEREFSAAGLIVNPKRTRINPRKLPKLLFMYSVDDSVWYA